MDGGVWRKALVYLGLVEEPEEHDELPEQFGRDEDPAWPPAASPVPPHARSASSEEVPANVRALRVPEPGSPHVRQVDGDAPTRVTIVEVGAFDDVEDVGARYRTGQPVLVDVRQVDRGVAQRVMDFLGGMLYAFRGRLTPAGPRAYLLVPEGVEIPTDERRRLDQLGYRGTQ